MGFVRTRRTLVDLIESALRADLADAPAVYLEADLFADDLARCAPTGIEPTDNSPKRSVIEAG